MGEEEKVEGEQEQLTEGEAEGKTAATGEGDKQGPIPYHRFKEVNDKLKQSLELVEKYKKLGDPDKLAGELGRLKDLSAANEFTPKERDLIAKQLFAVFPQLKGLVENADKLMKAAKFTEEAKEQYIDTTEKHVDSYLGKLGLPVNKKNNERLQELLIAELRQPENKPKMVAFLRGDKAVLDEMFKIVQREVFGGRRIAEGADLQQRKQTGTTKVQPTGGKPPPKEDKGPAKDFADAHEAAYELISQMER